MDGRDFGNVPRAGVVKFSKGKSFVVVINFFIFFLAILVVIKLDFGMCRTDLIWFMTTF